MTETWFTPGPWQQWTSNSHWRIGADGRDGNVLSASLATDGLPVIECADFDRHLIAASSDLYEALREAQVALNGGPNTEGLHEQINAALSRARGESSHV